MQSWVINTRTEVVVIDDDGEVYGPYENEALAREEWDKVTDYEWRVRPLNTMSDFEENA